MNWLKQNIIAIIVAVGSSLGGFYAVSAKNEVQDVKIQMIEENFNKLQEDRIRRIADNEKFQKEAIGELREQGANIKNIKEILERMNK